MNIHKPMCDPTRKGLFFFEVKFWGVQLCPVTPVQMIRHNFRVNQLCYAVVFPSFKISPMPQARFHAPRIPISPTA